MERQFTVEEANALIPTLSAILEDLRTLRDRLVAVAGEVSDFEILAMGNGHGEQSPIFQHGHNLGELRKDLRERLLLLQGMGVHLKDIENGIVDFPSHLRGHDVYLCWRLGEDEVAHWHEMDSGFAGRQPL